MWTEAEQESCMAEIRICIAGGEMSTARVRAIVYGLWAYHPATGPGELGWCVTHVPTGQRVTSFSTRKQARVCVHLLDEIVGYVNTAEEAAAQAMHIRRCIEDAKEVAS